MVRTGEGISGKDVHLDSHPVSEPTSFYYSPVSFTERDRIVHTLSRCSGLRTVDNKGTWNVSKSGPDLSREGLIRTPDCIPRRFLGKEEEVVFRF